MTGHEAMALAKAHPNDIRVFSPLTINRASLTYSEMNELIQKYNYDLSTDGWSIKDNN